MKWNILNNRNEFGTPVTNVYVLRTHILNWQVQETFTRMQAQLGAANVFLLFDETKTPLAQSHVKWDSAEGVDAGPAVITINEEDCRRINTLHNKGKQKGSRYKVEAQIYACYKAIRRPYDYLWFIEYDVYCNDFGKVLLPYDRVKADMLTKGTDFRYYNWIRTTWTTWRWYWWKMLEGEISNVPMRKRKGCFFPINRFSKRFLEVMEQNLSKSSGYCEVYFPTLCSINGLVLKSMNIGSFGTFRFRPSLTSKEIERIKPGDHRLYHPVKSN